MHKVRLMVTKNQNSYLMFDGIEIEFYYNQNSYLMFDGIEIKFFIFIASTLTIKYISNLNYLKIILTAMSE